MGNMVRKLGELPMRKSELVALQREVAQAEQTLARLEKRMRQGAQLDEQRRRTVVTYNAENIKETQRAMDAKVDEILARRRALETAQAGHPPSKKTSS